MTPMALNALQTPWLPTLCGLSVVLYVAWRALRRRSRINAPLPPGPRGLPLVGNIFDFPQAHYGPKLHNLADRYGE